MPAKSRSKTASQSKRRSRSAAKVALHARRGAFKVRHLEKPPTFVKPKRIHARHLLPLIREGCEREFHSQSAETIIRAFAMPRASAAGEEIALALNTELTGPKKQATASNVGEPSTAMNGNVVLYTGNWYAAVSSDGGRTFQYIDPATAFPDPSPTVQFCCDQVVHYISQIDTFVWLLQYGPDTGDNIQRLAFAKTADVVNGKWHLFDITTASLKVPGAFLDFPDLAVGAKNLYVTTNIFAPRNKTGSAVVRIPLESIEKRKVTATPFVSFDFQSFRVAQNCGTTAFFAAHENTSTLRVFSWKEGQTAPVPHSVGVARWIGGDGYHSRTPDGRRWLDRADPRISGATMTTGELFFAWSVDSSSNRRKNPFIQIARIDADNLTLIDNINVFDSANATCYCALTTNENNEVGMTYMTGGKTLAPSHVVGILGLPPNTRQDLIVAKGDRGPLDPDNGRGEWGDYLTCRLAFPNRKLFAAAGYTMQGEEDGTNRDATPRFVIFGRARDVGTATATGGIEVVTVVDGGTPDVAVVVVGGDTVVPAPTAPPPFSDVETLPVVSEEVAGKIKAAATAEGLLLLGEAGELAMLPELVESPLLATKPGVERWPVKTGTDSDVVIVGNNVIAGENLGAGIVEATIEELIRIGRPVGMRPATGNFDSKFHDRRLGVVEQTVWRIEGEIIALKLESDGDYHLVIQGASGETMIAECPMPTTAFVGSSAWLANMGAARQQIDNKLVNKLSPADFVPLDGKLVPRESLPPSLAPIAMAMAFPNLPASFVMSAEGLETGLPTFKTKVSPTRARITGVGLFDQVHGQMGVSQLNGIELHPVLKIEWI